jgi:nitrate/TMAO reductase-like tetraheme cytochrome c subunit
MAFRLGVSLATLFLVHIAVAAGAQPPVDSAAKSPANEDCLACHDESVAKPFAASIHAPVGCVDCHQDLAAVQEFPHLEKVAKVACATCHEDVATKYRDSIHWWGREKAGLVVAPSCADCHGTHDVQPKLDQASRVFRANVPATCGTCHEGVTDRYNKSIHAVAVKGEPPGSAAAPVCIDCHTAHQIQRADTESWRLGVTAECGTCHENVVDSFRRTFHGKVTELGFTRVAACADCHGAHDILPHSHPQSMVAKANLVQTCGRCHEGANEKFVEYDPHPNPRDYNRSPLLWWINRFYTVLIAGCFGLFGLHSLLWFRRERAGQARPGEGPRIRGRGRDPG